jgi:hypothetical protein
MKQKFDWVELAPGAPSDGILEDNKLLKGSFSI